LEFMFSSSDSWSPRFAANCCNRETVKALSMTAVTTAAQSTSSKTPNKLVLSNLKTYMGKTTASVV
jgi:hypothetical protein